MFEHKINSACSLIKTEWIMPEFGYGMSKSQSYPNDEKEQNMFVNEPEEMRTIDHERGIVLNFSSGQREGYETYTLTIGEKIIPFLVLTSRPISGGLGIIYTIFSMGGAWIYC